jgi:hypothetical protein
MSRRRAIALFVVVDWLSLVALAVLGGAAFGFMLRLGEVPVTKARSFPVRRATRD